MRLAGLSCAVPKTVAFPADAYATFGAAEVDRIIANIGVKEHREAPPGQTAADLAVAAGDPLIEKLGWERESIDACVFITQTPDHMMPGSAHRVARDLKLGLKAMCFDVNLGCSGFTHGVMIMRGLMAAGFVKRGLLVAGDVTTGHFREGIANCKNPVALGNSLLFGDACSVTAFESDGKDMIKAAVHGSDGNGYEQIYLPGMGYKMEWSPAMFEAVTDAKGDQRRPIDLVLNGPEVFTFTIRRVPPLLEDVLAQAGWVREEVDHFALHQANKFMLEFLRKKMKLPVEKTPISIDQFGNTSSASIPMTMLTRCSESFDRPTKWVMMGFGIGLSWSGIAIETDKIVSVPLVEI